LWPTQLISYTSLFSYFSSDAEKKKPALHQLERICSIPCRSSLSPSYFHSFGMTERYVVFVEQPYKLDILKLASAYFRGVNWGSCLKFDKDDVVCQGGRGVCVCV